MNAVEPAPGHREERPTAVMQDIPTFDNEGDRLDAIRRLIVTVQEQASPTDMVAQARIRKYRRWLHEMEAELGLDGYC